MRPGPFRVLERSRKSVSRRVNKSTYHQVRPTRARSTRIQPSSTKRQNSRQRQRLHARQRKHTSHQPNISNIIPTNHNLLQLHQPILYQVHISNANFQLNVLMHLSHIQKASHIHSQLKPSSKMHTTNNRNIHQVRQLFRRTTQEIQATSTNQTSHHMQRRPRCSRVLRSSQFHSHTTRRLNTISQRRPSRRNRQRRNTRRTHSRHIIRHIHRLMYRPIRLRTIHTMQRLPIPTQFSTTM